MGSRKWAWGIGVGLAALVLGTALSFPLSAYNFRAIPGGKAYRSNEPTRAAFAHLLRAHGIRTVVSFRGTRRNSQLPPVAERLGVRFVSLPLRDRTLPSRHQVLELLRLLEAAEPPLLLLDRFGAAQVGLAAAFFGIVRLGQDFATAGRALSLRQGSLPYGPQTEVTRAFRLYGAWLDRQGLPATRETLRRWATEGYMPYGYGARIHPVRLPERARPQELLRVTVDAENVSDRTWPKRTDPASAIKLGLRVAAAGAPSTGSLRGDLLPADVAPGGTARLSIDFAAPAVPGRYELSLDLVEEGKAWFSDWGFPPVTLLLQVD